jgi:hypothetical protein
MVVVMDPAVKGCGAFVACAVDRSVGPAGEHGADEAFGFAVCLGAASSGAEVFDPESPAGDRVDDGYVSGAVVCEDAFDGDPVAAEETKSADEEAGSSDCFLVWEHFGVGEAAVVVNGDVDELPSDRAVFTPVGFKPGGPVAARCPATYAFACATLDPSELLDVDVDELPGPAPLVADGWLETDPSRVCPVLCVSRA